MGEMREWEKREMKHYIKNTKTCVHAVHSTEACERQAGAHQAVSQVPQRSSARGAGSSSCQQAASKQWTTEGSSSEATSIHTRVNHHVQERDKWTPSPFCSPFLMTVYPVSWPLSAAAQTQRKKGFLHLLPEQQNHMGYPPAARSECSERLEGPPKPP